LTVLLTFRPWLLVGVLIEFFTMCFGFGCCLFWSERRFVLPTGGFGMNPSFLKQSEIFFGPAARRHRARSGCAL